MYTQFQVQRSTYYLVKACLTPIIQAPGFLPLGPLAHFFHLTSHLAMTGIGLDNGFTDLRLSNPVRASNVVDILRKSVGASILQGSSGRMIVSLGSKLLMRAHPRLFLVKFHITTLPLHMIAQTYFTRPTGQTGAPIMDIPD